MPDSGVKISSLPSAAAEDIQGTDVLAGVSDDETKKFSFSNILTWIKARLSKSDIGLDNVANVLQYSASNPPPYPVTSVNGQSGAVSITIPTPASPSDASPAMDGTAAAGSSPDFARGDHVHPTDTSRQATINVSGVLAGDGNGGVAAVTVDSSPDTSHTSNLISSAAVAGALTALESDLAAIHATGTTNTTGAAISSGTYFYLNGALVQAKANIASGATFTSGTNYEAVTAGGLNDLNAAINKADMNIAWVESNATASKNYINGECLLLDGDLYIALSNISSGAALIPGSNIIRSSIGAIVKDISISARHYGNGYVTPGSGMTINFNARSVGAMTYAVITMTGNFTHAKLIGTVASDSHILPKARPFVPLCDDNGGTVNGNIIINPGGTIYYYGESLTNKTLVATAAFINQTVTDSEQ